MALTSKIITNIVSTLTNPLDLTTPAAPHAIKKSLALATGTGANQADLVFSDTRTLGASANEDLDLAGVLTDPFGIVMTFARIKMMYFFAAAANTNNVEIGGAAATQFVNWVNAAADVIILRPGGVFLLTAPDATAYAVGAGASDFLRVTNGAAGTSVTYDIVLIGASA